MKDLFTYHPPKGDQPERYKAIRDAETDARLMPLPTPDTTTEDARYLYSVVNWNTKAFADTIEALSPPSADRTTAIRCVRLARMLMNEAITWASVHRDLTEGRRLQALAMDELMKARMWACAAIALNEE
jgi:hypothetical protein